MGFRNEIDLGFGLISSRCGVVKRELVNAVCNMDSLSDCVCHALHFKVIIVAMPGRKGDIPSHDAPVNEDIAAIRER